MNKILKASYMISVFAKIFYFTVDQFSRYIVNKMLIQNKKNKSLFNYNNNNKTF